MMQECWGHRRAACRSDSLRHKLADKAIALDEHERFGSASEVIDLTSGLFQAQFASVVEWNPAQHD
ncbi:MAG: hypothetical protein ACI841_000634 [Planctomycetota bacterium]|jgi:hypothetical protein